MTTDRRVRRQPTEIAPNVFEIPLLRVRAHLLVEDELTLVDAGLASSPRAIEAAIRALGRDPRDLTRVVCTHGHFDHAGGAAALERELDAQVLIHGADLANLPTTLGQVGLRPSRRVFVALTPVPQRAQPLHDGDTIPVLGGLRVIHVPGHTPGTICLYGERDRILFVGDAIQARMGRIGFASRLYSDDWAAARRGTQRLAELDVEMIVFSHYRSVRENANQVLRMLADEAARAEGTRSAEGAR